ncbi:MAG: hypothetical protein U0P48_04125 [Ancrocorticia sp.]
MNATVASRIFFSSQVAKYLPGGVWNFVAAAEEWDGTMKSRGGARWHALLVSIVISIVTGMILAILAVVLSPDNVRKAYGHHHDAAFGVICCALHPQPAGQLCT